MTQLCGKYVRVDDAGDRPLFGLFVETSPEDPSSGVMYDFARRKYITVATSRCRAIDSRRIKEGFMNVPVTVTEGDFGDGEVVGEWVLGGVFWVRVRSLHSRCTTLVTLSQLVVRLPPREE